MCLWWKQSVTVSRFPCFTCMMRPAAGMCSQQGRSCCLVWSFLWDKHKLEQLWKMRFQNSIVPWLYSWSSFNSVFSWVMMPSESTVIWSSRAPAVRETAGGLCSWLVCWKGGRLNNIPTRHAFGFLLSVGFGRGERLVLIPWRLCFVSNMFVLMHVLNVSINEHWYKQRGELLFITGVKLSCACRLVIF